MVKEKLKRISGQLFSIYNKPLKDPIWIFSTRRSGSTLLMEAITTQPHITYVNQPMNYWNYDPFKSKYPQLYNEGRIISVDQEGLLRDLFSKILSGKVWIDSQWNPLNSNFSFIVDRFVIKILNAKTLISWFHDEFGGKFIFLIRHPIPVSLSIIKKGWGCNPQSFLLCKSFRKKYIPDRIFDEFMLIYQKGTILQKYILEWVLENLVPLKIIGESQQFLLITYEELVIRPEEISSAISKYLDLNCPMLIANRLQIPSKTTVEESKNIILKKDPESLVYRWFGKISKNEQRQADVVLSLAREGLSLDIYNTKTPYPLGKFCLFGKL